MSKNLVGEFVVFFICTALVASAIIGISWLTSLVGIDPVITTTAFIGGSLITRIVQETG